jgi:hypothetical protein
MLYLHSGLSFLISLPSSFSISPSSFLSLPPISLHLIHMCSIVSPHSTFCTFFSSPSIQYLFSLLVPTSKSRLHFSFFCTSPQVLRNLDSLILSLLSCFSVSLSLSLNSIFIHFPFAVNFSTSSLAYPFL